MHSDETGCVRGGMAVDKEGKYQGRLLNFEFIHSKLRRRP